MHESLEKEVTRLMEVSAQLKDALSAVLRPEQPTTACEEAAPDRNPHSPLRERLNEYGNNVSCVSRRMADILERLDL